MLDPDDIEGRDFLVSLRGYDRAEVRSFLQDVAAHMRDLQDRVDAAEDAAEGLVPPPLPEERPAEETPAPRRFAEIGEETQRILEAAQEAAEDMLRKARVDADRELQAARHQAARLIAEGERRREEIEEVVAGLEAARGSLSNSLREIGRTIEHVMGELGAPSPPATTVREALTAEAAASAEREDRTEAHREDEAAAPAPAEAEVVATAPPDEPVAEPRVPDEPVAGPDEAVAGPDEPVAGPDEPVAGPDERVAGPDEPVAGPDERVAGPHERVAGPDADGPDEAFVGEAVDREDRTDPHAIRAVALTPLHPELVRSIKRGLQDVQNLALDRLRRSSGEGEPESLLPADEEVVGLGDLAAEALHRAYAAGVDAAARLADRDLRQPDGGRDLVEIFCSDAGERVRSPLAATLRMGRAADEPLAALVDRVGGVFAELKGTVAEELAATHLTRAYELGLHDTWAAGGISHRRWVLGREPRCPEARCRYNDQAGVVAMGEAYPSGHEAPPVHVGCTCTTLPVTEPPS